VSSPVWLVIFLFAVAAAALTISIRTVVAQRPVGAIGKAGAKEDFRAWAAWQASVAVAFVLFGAGNATSAVWLLWTGFWCMVAGFAAWVALTAIRRRSLPGH
jgi:hypothetical protein